MNNAARAVGVCFCVCSAVAAALAVDAATDGSSSVNAQAGMTAGIKVASACMAHPIASVAVVAAACWMTALRRARDVPSEGPRLTARPCFQVLNSDQPALNKADTRCQWHYDGLEVRQWRYPAGNT
jgi:hypothetical protein